MTEEMDFREAMDEAIDILKDQPLAEPKVWVELDDMMVIVSFRLATDEELYIHRRETGVQ